MNININFKSIITIQSIVITSKTTHNVFENALDYQFNIN